MPCLASVLAKETTLRKQGYLVETMLWVEIEGLQMLLIQMYQVGKGEPCWQRCKKEERACSRARTWPEVNEGLMLQTCGE